jgi:flavin reductase (DIM6/NTAB) family NADH-FMN oxidoreductase RutF
MIETTTFDLKMMKPAEIQTILQHAIAPRPICFASTIDKNGNANLSPFSFFNLFSSNPPILVFSPARRVRDNTIKHTLENVLEIDEVCINMVNYDMVWQTSLASTEYEKGVDEFVKSGFTKETSQLIKPYRVKESPIQLECKVLEVKSLGDKGGAGNLVICEVLVIHVNNDVLDAEKKQIDQNKLDLVARLGGDWYCRASGEALFEIEKPVRNKGIGIDQIREDIRNSHFLTGNDLGQLGNVEQLPTKEDIESVSPNIAKKSSFEKHKMAHELLAQKLVQEAWKILLS